MKAFLLAAGLGTRLRPLTDQLPKCLLPIGSQPLLAIWLELLGCHGVEDVLINTHYLPETVRMFAAGWSGLPKLHLSHEGQLLGSAGTVAKNWDFISGEKSFLVCNADNLTNIDLGKLIRFHQTHCGLITMSLFHSNRPTECGMVEIDGSGQVLTFQEKPAVPKSALANGGIYVMRAEIRPRSPAKKPSDIGFDLLPQCLGEMHGWLSDDLLIDIGNPNSYSEAQEAWFQRRGRPVFPASAEKALSTRFSVSR